jgi:hypothetical protein
MPKKKAKKRLLKKQPKKIIKSKTKKKNVKRKTLRKTIRQKRSTSQGSTSKNSSTRKTTKKRAAKSGKVVPKNSRAKLQKRKRKAVSNVRLSSTRKTSGRKTTRKQTSKKRVKNLATKKARKKTITELITKKLPGKDNAGNIIAPIGNSIFIDLSPFRTFKDKVNAIRNWSGKPLQWFIDRYLMLPRAFQVILRTFKKGKGNKPHERANRMSPFEMSVNVDNIKNLILEYMVANQDNYIEYIESNETGEQLDSDWVYNPAMIKAVIVRFFYPQ